MRRGFSTSSSRSGVSATLGAAAPEMNIVVVDLKSVRFEIRQRQPIQAWIINIDDAPAIHADEMMMLIEFGIETCRRTGVTGPGDQTKRNKGTQDPMDGHARNLRQFATDRGVNLFSRRVIDAVQDCFKNGTPLGRDRQTALTMHVEETLHSLFFVSQPH